MNDKKGIMSFYFMTWALRFIFLVIVLVVDVLLISMFLNNKFDISDIQSEVVINGLVYGTGGLSYVDPLTARIYPQIIDINQLDSMELDMGMYYPNNNLIAAKIVVERQSILTPVKTVYFNKEWYDNWKPLLALKHLKGLGGVTDYEKTLPVIIRDEKGELRAGYVEFQVVQPRGARVKTK